MIPRNRQSRGGPRFFFRWALPIALGLLASACGIEDVPFLYEPTVTVQTSGNMFQLTNSTQNDASVFLGYEFFYRLYNELADAQNDKTAIEAFSADNVPSVTISKLKSDYTYQRFYGLTDETLPFLLFENMGDRTDDSFSTTVTFNFALNDEAILSSADDAITKDVYRGVLDGTAHKSFSEISLAEADVKKNGISTSPLYLQVFVASYGIDFTTFASYYSEPVWMGYIDITANGASVTE